MSASVVPTSSHRTHQHRAARLLVMVMAAAAVTVGSLANPAPAGADTGRTYAPASVGCNLTNIGISAQASRPDRNWIAWRTWAINTATGEATNIGAALPGTSPGGWMLYLPEASGSIFDVAMYPAEGVWSVTWTPPRHGWYRIVTEYGFRNADGSWDGGGYRYVAWTQSYAVLYRAPATACYA